MVVAIGVLLGLVMGLTGAGGSVFALPLLVLLLDMPLAVQKNPSGSKSPQSSRLWMMTLQIQATFR